MDAAIFPFTPDAPKCTCGCPEIHHVRACIPEHGRYCWYCGTSSLAPTDGCEEYTPMEYDKPDLSVRPTREDDDYESGDDLIWEATVHGELNDENDA